MLAILDQSSRSFIVCSGDADLTDEQWAIVAPLLPPAKTGGRPRTTDLRSTLNAVLFLVKERCRWRTLNPMRDFPPWPTVYRYFAAWKRRGIRHRIHYHLYGMVRVTLEDRKPQPTALVIDTQSIKTSKMAGKVTRGYDGGKKIKGRKRVIVTDTCGLLVEGSVTRANMHHTRGCATSSDQGSRIPQTARRQKSVRRQGFPRTPFAGWVKSHPGAVVETSANPTKAATGGKLSEFVVAKRRGW
jgi:putative transposase